MEHPTGHLPESGEAPKAESGTWSEWLAHTLPVALILAFCFTTLQDLKPDALAGIETVFMRTAYMLDGELGQLSEELSALRRELAAGSSVSGDSRSPIISVVYLTPEANDRYFQGTTPVPRGRLACVIYAFAETLKTLKQKPPVVGIDIDVTPVDTLLAGPLTSPGSDAARNQWLHRPDEESCFKALGEPLTYEIAIKAALLHLAQTSCVVAITFPRLQPDARVRRNEFTESLRRIKAETSTDRPPCAGIRFASPEVVQVTHELVYQYPTARLGDHKLSSGLRSKSGPDGDKTILEEVCTLGRALGAHLHELRPKPEFRHWWKPHERRSEGSVSCASEAPNSTVLMNELPVNQPGSPNLAPVLAAGAYKHRVIQLGRAKAAIAYENVDPADRPDNLLGDAQQAFHGLDEADVYVLSVDSGMGSTDDRFSVPVSESTVPGAWIHAAVALTEYEEPTGSELKSDWVKRGWYLWHVATDVIEGLALALVFEIVFKFLRRHFVHPVVHDIGLAVVPVIVTAAFVIANFMWTAEGFFHGEWHSPAAVLIGMALHAYLHIAVEGSWRHRDAVHAAKLRHSQGPAGRSDPIRMVAQGAWVSVTVASALFGLKAEPTPLAWTVVGLWLACLYLAAARRFTVLPLPWRLHESASLSRSAA